MAENIPQEEKISTKVKKVAKDYNGRYKATVTCIQNPLLIVREGEKQILGLANVGLQKVKMSPWNWIIAGAAVLA